MLTKPLNWLDERLKIGGLVDYMSHKVVPQHHESAWYYFGGISLFLFLVQVGTGILLLLYYRPGSDSAYESVQFIISEVTFGWLIRAIHSWSANLMILAAFIHMFSVFFTHAFRKPRELTWVTGVGLLGLGLAFGLLFELLIRGVENLETKHHLFLGIIIPVIAVINFIIVSNNMKAFIGIENPQNPVIVGIVYAVAFMLPYISYQVFLKNR